MFLKFNQKINTIFLDTNSDTFTIEDKVNVILSPSLYWVKKVTLPVKYLREVKPLLASLFEEILPEGNYSYYAYKKEEHFYIFAYEDKVILDTLKEKGIAPAQIQNVYFSQAEFESITNPMKIDKNQSIYVREELVVLLPSLWSDTGESLDIEGITLSNRHISLNQYGHIVDNKSLYAIMGIFVLLITLVSVEYFIVYEKNAKIVELRDELFVKHGLKSTMMQNRSMFKEYKAIHSKQISFREHMSYILALKLLSKQKVSSVILKNDALIVDFTGVVKGSTENILKQFTAHNLKFKSNFKTNTWQVEFSL